jgi:8-oxo-dGTP pyrophosphatase MutT (NUDIX family)
MDMHDSAGTELKVATIDVYLLRRGPDGLRVLVLRRTPRTRCPGSWEAVHGRIEAGEKPEHAAIREAMEESGLTVRRLYTIEVQPFYLPSAGIVTAAVVFAGFVDDGAAATLSDEHDAFEWLTPDEAGARFSWPRSRRILPDIVALLASGDAGSMEDALRVG